MSEGQAYASDFTAANERITREITARLDQLAAAEARLRAIREEVEGWDPALEYYRARLLALLT